METNMHAIKDPLAGLHLTVPKYRGTLESIRYPALASRKYDGEFNWIIYSDERWILVNKNGKIRTHHDFLDVYADSYLNRTCVYLCELYADGGRSGALYNLLKDKESDDLNIAIFDVWAKDNPTASVRYNTILGEIPDTWMARTRTAKDRNQVSEFFDDAVNDGFEGIVVKSADSRAVLGNNGWCKMKKTDETQCRVTKIDNCQERIEVMPALSFCVSGVKCSHAQKRLLHVNDVVTIRHFGFLNGGGMRNPVLLTTLKGVR
jgi:hypothetical protein